MTTGESHRGYSRRTGEHRDRRGAGQCGVQPQARRFVGVPAHYLLRGCSSSFTCSNLPTRQGAERHLRQTLPSWEPGEAPEPSRADRTCPRQSWCVLDVAYPPLADEAARTACALLVERNEPTLAMEFIDDGLRRFGAKFEEEFRLRRVDPARILEAIAVLEHSHG